MRAPDSLLRLEVGHGRARRAEEHERLIDQVRAEVVQDPRAGRILLSPALLDVGAGPVECASYEAHLAEQALLDAAAHGAEVRVPAAVLEKTERSRPRRAAGAMSFVRLGARDREQLVDDHDACTRLEHGARAAKWVSLGEAMTTRSIPRLGDQHLGRRMQRGPRWSAAMTWPSRRVAVMAAKARPGGWDRISGRAWKTAPARP